MKFFELFTAWSDYLMVFIIDKEWKIRKEIILLNHFWCRWNVKWIWKQLKDRCQMVTLWKHVRFNEGLVLLTLSIATRNWKAQNNEWRCFSCSSGMICVLCLYSYWRDLKKHFSSNAANIWQWWMHPRLWSEGKLNSQILNRPFE